ncbi:MAG: formylglycine-generating enzyme family protein [Betaproteobacteria bacterium]|nr:formylglycine-generating enzyme family protein [Betaproteobacteria bacterium]
MISRIFGALLLAPLLGANATHATAQDLVVLARVRPWPAVSKIIGYGDRLWFANSVKFRDHNSADLYSYHPGSGEVRYERHLFSQDAGNPAVVGGLIYWPFEDARFSVGRGEFLVSNGRDWQWRALPHPGVLHLHAMFARGGSLYAASGGFRAALHRSDDGGASWRLVYEHSNAAGSFSRLLSLGELGGRIYAGLYASGEPGAKLLRLRRGRLVPVPGWPPGESADSLAAFRGWLYAIHSSAGGSRLWRTNGRRSEPLRGLASVNVRSIAASRDSLWALSMSEGGGTLWQSRDGTVWSVRQRFAGDVPVEVATYAGRAYVGAIGGDGRGVLYGPAVPAPAGALPAPAALPLQAGAPEPDPRATLQALDRALADFSAFEARGGSLIGLLEPLLRTRSLLVAQALAQRLGRVPRSSAESRFAGRTVPAADKADWQLLWAIARLGRGRIPPALLDKPFEEAPSRGEKFAEPAAAAAWAVGELGQADDETLARLIARLDRREDPPWLAGDMAGALVAVTGCRFGYDAAAWRAWWRTRDDCRAADGGAREDNELVSIPGGSFVIGDARGEPDEAPRQVTVKPFRMMRHEITNGEFAQFVAATGYSTDAERSGSGYVWTDRWREVAGAQWRRPQGPESSLHGLDRHPVVQVSARDAAAYCAWRGLRLPTEEEWEFAARGTDGRSYPWGNEPPAQMGERRANFGSERCCAPDASDGFERTAPVESYALGTSPFGLADMAGNVWEWTSAAYSGRSGQVALRGGGWGNDPYGLRASYRHGNPPDIGLDMVGFRCAGD